MTVDVKEAAMCACFHLRKATRSLTRFYDDQLREHGITTPQFTILVLLEENDESKITPLADQLGMDRTTLTRNLERLEEEDLVESGRSDEDRRARVVSLTPEGREKLRQASPDWRQAQKQVVEELGEEPFRQFVGTLDRIPDIVGE